LTYNFISFRLTPSDEVAGSYGGLILNFFGTPP
jgi:hypothetical protein